MNYKRDRRLFFCCLVFVSFLGGLVCDLHAQDENATRPAPPASTNRPTKANRKKGSGRSTTPKPTPARIKPGTLYLAVSPANSSVWINGEPQKLDASGTIFLTLPPMLYTITARHSGYGGAEQTVNLKTGDNSSLALTLELLKGTLAVRPNVDGTEIEVRNIRSEPAHGFVCRGDRRCRFSTGRIRNHCLKTWLCSCDAHRYRKTWRQSGDRAKAGCFAAPASAAQTSSSHDCASGKRGQVPDHLLER